MTKSQAINTLKEADQKCRDYLQLKLMSEDLRGAIVVLTELIELKAQIQSLQSEFQPEPDVKEAEPVPAKAE